MFKCSNQKSKKLSNQDLLAKTTRFWKYLIFHQKRNELFESVKDEDKKEVVSVFKENFINLISELDQIMPKKL